MLAEKMKQEAKKNNYEVAVDANVADNVEDIVEDYDIILLAPQVSYKQADVKKIVDQYNDIKLDVIDSLAYGQLDGAAVLKQALNLG
jgi:PTS system cellobiose-specific IIB component